MGTEQLSRIDVERQLVDLMPQSQQLLDGLLQGGGNRRIKRRTGQRLTHHGHTKLARLALQFLYIRTHQWWAPIRTARFMALPDIKEQRGIAYRA
ncbi:hypothetical protein D3C84_1018330 [compost metagenome]